MFLENLSKDPKFFFAVCGTVIISICIHELAHGIVAIWHGDRTPIETGHMTLDPLVHMGGMSFLLLVIAGIAWGSMPVNPSRMRGRYAAAIVAAAGPASNVLLAIISLGGLGLWMRFHQTLGEPNPIEYALRYFAWIFGTINVSLALFNLIPIPPLDGSRILADFSSGYARLMNNLAASGQIMIPFMIMFFFAGNYIIDFGAKGALSYLKFVRGY